MNTYTVKIANPHGGKERSVKITGDDPMAAHKSAYMNHTVQDEEIQTMVNEDNDVVFDVRKGFIHAVK